MKQTSSLVLGSIAEIEGSGLRDHINTLYSAVLELLNAGDIEVDFITRLELKDTLGENPTSCMTIEYEIEAADDWGDVEWDDSMARGSIFHEGEAAFEEGKPRDGNPYPMSQENRRGSWFAGWEHAYEQANDPRHPAPLVASDDMYRIRP